MPRRSVCVALGAWCLLMGAALWWGQVLLPGGLLNVSAPPFQGIFRPLLFPLVPAAVFAAATIAGWPRLAPRLGWRTLLIVSWALTVAWAVLLATSEGVRRLWSPITRPREYVAALPDVGHDPLGWLSSFTDHFARHPLHVRGHPPLMVLVLWAWDQLGPSRDPWSAVLVVGVGASTTVAVAMCVRLLTDEATARAALPFLVLAPTAVTVATSADGFFAGIGAWGVALLCLGLLRRSGWWAGAGGLLLGSLPYLSYGLLPYAAVPVAVVLVLRRRRAFGLALGGFSATTGAALAGAVVVPVLMTVGGFWWLDGVSATHRAWAAGHGDDRPYAYSLVGDAALLAMLVGPATASALSRLRPHPVTALAVASTLGLLVLDLSGVTRLEVERIWLPYAPWLLTLNFVWNSDRRWLALNAATALAWQALVHGVW